MERALHELAEVDVAVRVAVKYFGSIWELRQRWQLTRNPRAREWLGRLNDAYWRRFGSYIGVNAQFACPPTFPHGPYGVFISGSARVGHDAVIFQHVTIGSNTLPDSRGKGAPRLGDSCFLGAGASVIGGVTVGDNVRIGSNCVVAHDVPANCVVVAQPPRVIPREGMVNRHYTRLADGQWVYLRGEVKVPETDERIIALLDAWF